MRKKMKLYLALAAFGKKKVFLLLRTKSFIISYIHRLHIV